MFFQPSFHLLFPLLDRFCCFSMFYDAILQCNFYSLASLPVDAYTCFVLKNNSFASNTTRPIRLLNESVILSLLLLLSLCTGRLVHKERAAWTRKVPAACPCDYRREKTHDCDVEKNTSRTHFETYSYNTPLAEYYRTYSKPILNMDEFIFYDDS